MSDEIGGGGKDEENRQELTEGEKKRKQRQRDRQRQPEKKMPGLTSVPGSTIVCDRKLEKYSPDRCETLASGIYTGSVGQ